MILNHRFLFILLMIASGTASAEWLEFGSGSPEDSSPRIFHNITLDDRVSFDVELSGLLADTVLHDSIPYLRLHRNPGTTPMDSVGFPELPAVVCFVAVPDDADLDLSYSANCPATLALSLPIYPAPLDSLVTDSTSTPYIGEFFTKDSTAYASEEWFPEELAEIVGEFHLRDQRVAVVAVHPVQYLASEDSLRLWSDLEMSVLLDGEEMDWNEDGLGYYDRLIGDALLGYTPDYEPIDSPSPEVVRHHNTDEDPGMDPDYIIIVADGLDGRHIDDFADYRSDFNEFDVLIATTGDILTGYGNPGALWISPEMIRDYTEAVWDWSTPSTRPTYLLLVGDHEDAGTFSESYRLPTMVAPTMLGIPSFGNDEWYAYFGSPREVVARIPSLLVGRISSKDPLETADLLQVIQDFESPLVVSQTPDRRRHLIRLSGEGTEDNWDPDLPWTEDLCRWMAYDLSSHYCGDGDPETGGDGSTMSSGEWRDACISEFEDGAQVAFYTDHGDFHMFSAGLDWGLTGLGAFDSTFNNYWAGTLVSGSDYWRPFLLMLCCSAGTFDHTEALHPEENSYEDLCLEDETRPTYDFGSDCLAEVMFRNTDAGAIGVIASSRSSVDNTYEFMGKGILEAIYHFGITRLGDALLAGRLHPDAIGYFYGWSNDQSYTHRRSDLGRFNLIGDPAVDIGDRVAYPGNCDLIIAPSDLELLAYPTQPIGEDGTAELAVSVRNAGGHDAASFNVAVSISDGGSHSDFIVVPCTGIQAGEEVRLDFSWTSSWFSPPGLITVQAEAADPGGLHGDSWTGNNAAEAEIQIEDFYPNQSGWPVRLPGNPLSPPVLYDLDGSSRNDLELLVATDALLMAYRHDEPEPFWMSEPRNLGSGGFPPYSAPIPSIPVIGNVLGGGEPEILIDGQDELLVFGTDSPQPLCAFSHPLGTSWAAPHTVALGDFFAEADHSRRDEIVVVRGYRLQVFDIDASGDLVIAREEVLLPPPYPTGSELSAWPMVTDLNGTGSPEIIVQLCRDDIGAAFGSIGSYLFVYDADSESILFSHEWLDQEWRTVPCIGSLPSLGNCIILPTDEANSSQNPALILDADASGLPKLAECEWIQSPTSGHVPVAVMADWESPPGVADRVLANAENQCFAWDEDGDPITNYPITYTTAGSARPPFPALGELDNQDSYNYSDFLVATREGKVFAYSSTGILISELGFPYTLPSSVYGGFAIADIDNDGYVEVVFGTMDNYLHVWQLGECDEGYAPWPQCQHDAARTGVLLE